MSQVLGHRSSLGRVDRFMRNAQGTWLESHSKNGTSVPLPPALGQAFGRYLVYLNIDAFQPLPDMAKASDNPIIAQAAYDIRRLTAAMVSNRLVAEG